jgi:signal transduction histidine kinase
VQEPYRTGALLSLLRLHWFIRLRWVMVVGLLAVLGIERFVAPEARRPLALGLTLLALAIANLLWMGISRLLVREFATGGDADATGITEGTGETIRRALVFANIQVGFDLLALTLILRFAGGVENPMAIFYLFHMAIGSLVLKAWQAVAQGIWALGLFAALGLGEWAGWIAPHYEFLPWLAPAELFTRGGYVIAVIAATACGIFGTLAFMLQVAARLDERERLLRRAHAAVQKSQTAIMDLQERRSRFMWTAAHQLKAPLASIQTMVGLIRDKVVPEGSLGAHCKKIVDRCREGIAQVSELLALARMQATDPARHRQLIADVGRTAQTVCEQLRPLANEKQISLSCEVPQGDDLAARIDPTDLTHCITNLVDNAIKYTPGPGSVNVSVQRTPGSEPGVDFVATTVKDTGVGMDPEDLTGTEGPTGPGSVFDAFRRGNQALAGAIPGTGLGLSIVREVVEQAGGWIQVQSQVGQGSTFTVAFPARESVSHGPAVRDTRSREIIIVESPAPPADAGQPTNTERVVHAG